jgi:hypothetical protein
LTLLSKQQFDLAKYLFTFLALVDFHVESNQMNAKNLSIVWGPVLLRRTTTTATATKQSSAEGTVTNQQNNTIENNTNKTIEKTQTQIEKEQREKQDLIDAVDNLREMSSFGGDLVRRLIENSEQIFLSTD